jgi:hypothetical protein
MRPQVNSRRIGEGVDALTGAGQLEPRGEEAG